MRPCKKSQESRPTSNCQMPPLFYHQMRAANISGGGDAEVSEDGKKILKGFYSLPRSRLGAIKCVYLAPSSYQGSARSGNILLTLNYLHFNTWSIPRSDYGKANLALRQFSWGSLCFWSIVGHILIVCKCIFGFLLCNRIFLRYKKIFVRISAESLHCTVLKGKINRRLKLHFC